MDDWMEGEGMKERIDGEIEGCMINSRMGEYVDELKNR